MATNPASIQLPTQAPFINPDGTLTQTAVYFLMSLLNRTGGVPGVPIAELVAQVQALQVEVASADWPLPDAPPAIPSGVFMLDEPPPPSVNPYLAALLMQDVS